MHIHLINLLVASAVVIGGLLALNYFLRHYYSKSFINKSQSNNNLKLEDILYIDTSNRVVVVSRQNKQYVLLISSNNNLLIDTNDVNSEALTNEANASEDDSQISSASFNKTRS